MFSSIRSEMEIKTNQEDFSLDPDMAYAYYKLTMRYLGKTFAQMGIIETPIEIVRNHYPIRTGRGSRPRHNSHTEE